MKRLLFLGLLGLTACGPSHFTVTVLGASGKPFTAPDLCSALIACKNSTESACYYNRDIQKEADGTIVEAGCKQVQK